ncbi:MAG: DEAD/DEAH box helicase [Trichloromonas sp.]|jgi:superfamily II DNA or RNA helicase|nr:DEAD/DEAH box helicase [Trichloromonas sp.]
MSPVDSATEKLLTSYRKLPPVEQQVARMLAFFLAPVSRTNLAQCLSRAGVRHDTGRAIDGPSLLPLLRNLQKAGLATEIQGGFLLRSELNHPLLRELDQEGTLPAFAEAVKPSIRNSYYNSLEHCLQDLQRALYLRDLSEVSRVLDFYYSRFDGSPYGRLFAGALDGEWFRSLPPELWSAILIDLTMGNFLRLKPTDAFDILNACVADTPKAPLNAKYHVVFYKIMRGRLQAAEAAIAQLRLEPFAELAGVIALLRGQVEEAALLFEQGLTHIKKEMGKRKICFPGMIGIFHQLVLLRAGLPEHLKTAVQLAAIGLKKETGSIRFLLDMLSHLAEAKQGSNRCATVLKDFLRREDQLKPFEHLIRCLVAFQLKADLIPPHRQTLKRVAEAAHASGFLWLGGEALLLLEAFEPKEKLRTEWAQKLFAEEGISGLTGGATDEQNWQRSLKALLALGSGATAAPAAVAAKASRLVWLIQGDDRHIAIQPIEQKLGARGWSKGRNVALKRLAEEAPSLDFLTPQDHKAIACIRKERGGYGYYSQMVYEFDVAKTLRALIDHPLIFNAGHEDEPLTLAKGEFTLEVLRAKGKLNVRLSPLPEPSVNFFWHWEGPARLLLYEPTAEQRRIAAILGEKLSVPHTGEKELLAAITAVSPHVLVHSDLAGENLAAKNVEADSRLHLLLRPSGSGLGLEVRVFPFGEQGPRFLPGQGGATVIAEIQGEKRQCSRNQIQERQRQEKLLQSWSGFEFCENHDGFWRWEEPQEALELLEALHKLMSADPEAYVIRWPEGEKLRLRGTASWERLKLAVRSGKDWFSLEGEVALDANQVLSLQRLLELAEQEKGRFIQLADGEFVALTEEFRRRLDELRRVVDRHGKEPRFHPLAATLVNEALGGAGGLKGDKSWKAALERFRAAEALQPTVPATLRADLRDYQQEGFEWLSRLAHWGVGACLADDMGLGKTVQALALLIDRAPAGPALVLAPTSVCLNWESEARRFAPTLRPRIFGGGDRQAFVESLQPFDLAICSYTLFQQEAERLTGIRWETVVLDEAQAIKNMTTKRSQAAMQLNAGFRIATTGTPVENRLDELWNLFRFLNPGLLGSHQSFTTRFANPIERERDKAARTLLKKLIRPFILRRSKSQVLEELPPRTEIVQRVELSPEEAAFYEALRRQALDNLQGTDGQSPGERQIRILAEIMRLRRACCHPRLVLPDSPLSSAKLAAFREIVDELRANGHRALVFSQFVSHLDLLREELDKDGIGYRYLDGSTPAKERQAQVAAFQAGQGELFLISLKAGGVGLNLTAADYVIHMDPWWNPAVEDQASDRAHRIGQQRPVTVYRLVAANTIEEKIVALHGQKRELADSLLEGTETALRVSADDLLELLREGGEG